MKMRTLILMPLIWSVAVCATGFLLLGKPVFQIFWRIELEAARLAFIAGCLTCALTFQSGDYLRRAWICLAISMAIYLSRDVTLYILSFGFGTTMSDLINSFMVIAGNTLFVIGMYLLARAWKVAELKLPGSKQSQRTTYAIVAALAITIAGPTAWTNLIGLIRGDTIMLVDLASALGDIISLCLITPLLLTALALRGGHLSRPWFLLAASMLGWLLYDAATLAPMIGVEREIAKIFTETFRALACLFGCSAGLAHRQVVIRMRSVQNLIAH